MNQIVTNKDAKIIYTRYQYKRLQTLMFPTIYIDKYWDYTIDLFNLKKDWETFLDTFNKEFSSAKQYIEESNRVLNILYENLFVPDISQKVDSYKVGEPKFKRTSQYELPDGEYWTIDLRYAENQVLKYLDLFKPNVTYDSVINDVTSSTLLRSSKMLRLALYEMLHISKRSVLYYIYSVLLYNVLESTELKDIINIKENVLGITGDCLYITNNVDLSEGDFTINDIGVHIRKTVVKSIKYKNSIVKYTDKGGLTTFYKDTYNTISADEYLCVMKASKNQQPNEIDLTVGFEEEIFYVMN